MFKLWQKSKDQTGQLIHSVHSHSISPNTSLSSKVTARPCWGKGFKSEVIDVVLVILKRRRALTSCALITTAAPNRAFRAAILSHISQLRRRVTVRRAFSSAIMWRPIKAHAFTVSAGMQGANSTTFPRVPTRTNTSPQRFVPHLWHHASLGRKSLKTTTPSPLPLFPSPSLPPPKPFWLKPFPVQTFAVAFPLTSLSGFDLSKCLQLSFVVSHMFSWCVLAMGQTCFFLGHQLLLRISVLLTIPAHHSYDAQFKEVRDILLPLVQGFKDLDKHSRPFVRPWYCHLQNYWCRTDRQYPLCQFGFICKDGAKCQRPFTERLLQFPCEQFHAGVSTWFDKFLATADIPAANKPIKIHCKTGSDLACIWDRSQVSRIRGTFQGWWYSVSLFWCANQNHKMIVKLENDLRHFGMPCLK